MHVIVAPSAFTRKTFAEALPGVPVLLTRVPLQMPEAVAANPTRFGLQPDRVWFGSSFGPQRDPARKNLGPRRLMLRLDLWPRHRFDGRRCKGGVPHEQGTN